MKDEKGTLNNKGIRKLYDGNQVEGILKDGYLQGKGKKIYSKGTIEEGEFKDNE